MSIEDSRRNACNYALQSIDEMTQQYFTAIDTLKENIEAIKLLDAPSDEAAPDLTPVVVKDDVVVKDEFPFLRALETEKKKDDDADKESDQKKCCGFFCKNLATATREVTCSWFACKTVMKSPVCESCARSRFLLGIALCGSCKNKIRGSCKRKTLEKFALGFIQIVLILLLASFGFLLLMTMLWYPMILRNELPLRHMHTPPLTDQNYGSVWLNGEYTWTGWDSNECLKFDEHTWNNGHRIDRRAVICLTDSDIRIFKNRFKESKISIDDVFAYIENGAYRPGAIRHKRTETSFYLSGPINLISHIRI